MTGVSPLERRLLLALVSLMRDLEPDGLPLDDEYAERNDVRLADLYERCYVLDPAKSWELQRRNQRQALRRALGRLRGQGFVSVLALAWCEVGSGDFIEWQGGGRRSYRRAGEDAYFARHGERTPNWKMTRLTREGIQLAQLLEREQTS